MGLGAGKTYRNPALLSLAQKAPHCMGCDRRNDGTVVSAHSNQGKGMGIKASDATLMFLCRPCHSEYDQGAKMIREEKRQFAFYANAKTLRWLLEQGFLHVQSNGGR